MKKFVKNRPGLNRDTALSPLSGGSVAKRERPSEWLKPVGKGVLLAGLPLAGTAILSGLYRETAQGVILSLAITFGTISYHVVMRLLVGLLLSVVMQNKADFKKKWYHVGRREMELYEKLHIKNWKHRMPTYDPTLFDPRIHTWSEIAQAMCQAELVHETIALLSLLPIAGGYWFGAYPVFIVTSLLAAVCDMLFVMVQRYNRQRILRLLERKGGRKQKHPDLGGA